MCADFLRIRTINCTQTLVLKRCKRFVTLQWERAERKLNLKSRLVDRLVFPNIFCTLYELTCARKIIQFNGESLNVWIFIRVLLAEQYYERIALGKITRITEQEVKLQRNVWFRTLCIQSSSTNVKSWRCTPWTKLALILRIPWTEKRSSISIIKGEICRSDLRLLPAKNELLGHVVISENSLEIRATKVKGKSTYETSRNIDQIVHTHDSKW